MLDECRASAARHAGRTPHVPTYVPNKSIAAHTLADIAPGDLPHAYTPGSRPAVSICRACAACIAGSAHALVPTV